jgi:hypothetical protein
MATEEEIEEFLEQQSGNKISDEDVNSSLLPFFLEDIMNKGLREDSIREYPNKNIIKITSIAGQVLNDPISGFLDTSFTNGIIQEQLPAYMNLFSRRKEDSLLCEENFFTDSLENTLLFNRAVPYIKLYKIFETNISGKKTYSELHLPFEVISTNVSNPSLYEEDIVQKILNGGGDGAVGIANFDWTSDGRNEANKTQYTVNFKIVMQSIRELDRIRNSDGTNKVSILNLLYPIPEKQQRDKRNTDTEKFDPADQLIKAEVGYSLPTEYKQKYEKYFKTTLSLFLHKHNFTFHENGRVDLDITYIANIENEFGNPVKWNILSPEEVRILQEDIKILKNLSVDVNNKIIRNSPWQFRRFRTSLGYGGGARPAAFIPPGLSDKGGIFWGQANITDQSLYTNIHIKEVIKTISEELKKIKLSIFVKLINKLIENEKINSFVLDNQETLNFKAILSINNYDNDSLNLIKQSIGNLGKSITNNITKPKKPDEINVETVQTKVNSEGVFGAFAGFFGFQETKNVIDQEKLAQQLENINGQEQGSRMDFIYLGDLLQNILDISLSKDDKENFNIFLSPFGYIDYKSLSSAQIGNDDIFSSKKLPDGSNKRVLNLKGLKRKTHSMAYIPITIPSLVRWWNREIIEKNETHYSLFKLIRDIMTTLVAESISIRKVPNSPTQYFGTMNFNFNTKEKLVSPPKKSLVTNQNVISINNLSSYFASREDAFNQSNDLQNNIVFISSREDPNLPNIYKGDFQLDCQKNIFHAQINNSNSIIRKASFKRDDNAKLETANLLAAADNGSNEIIRQVYHCTLEMVGNNFFEPGSLIYIRPSFPGTNLQNELLHQIGLGGYYRIIKIDNKISNSGYTSTLQCRWEMWGPRG